MMDYPQLPYHHDLLSYINAGGIFVGLLIIIAILSKKENSKPILIYGLIVFIMTMIILDVFLCHTGMMQDIIYLNDFSEPLVLWFPPLFYLFLWNCFRKWVWQWKYTIHIIIPIGYLLLVSGYFFDQNAVKYNAYISGYYPDSDRLPTNPNQWKPYYEFAKANLHETIIILFTIYSILGIKLMLESNHTSIIKERLINKYEFSWITLIGIILSGLIMTIIFFLYQSDLGDILITTFMSVVIFLSGFLMISSSKILSPHWDQQKYATSSKSTFKLSLDESIKRIRIAKIHLSQNASLKELSAFLNITPNHLSQMINQETNQNFNDFINSMRIEEAKLKLIDPVNNHLTIEAIGNSVGFKSKSSFYSAFKKHTDITPLQWQKSKK